MPNRARMPLQHPRKFVIYASQIDILAALQHEGNVKKPVTRGEGRTNALQPVGANRVHRRYSRLC
jgi:hypothetical protein